jgi:hypothetical protein
MIQGEDVGISVVLVASVTMDYDVHHQPRPLPAFILVTLRSLHLLKVLAKNSLARKAFA